MSSTMISPKPLPKRDLRMYRPKKVPVTIAAGFRYRDGILLCADREITEGVSKFSQCKISGEEISSRVSLGFTFAGTVDYAEMAIQEITAVVKSSHFSTQSEIWGAIKDVIQGIYTDSIGGLLESRQADAGFSLLIAIWAQNQLKLYATEDTAVREVSQFRCIGVSKELAKYILAQNSVEGSDRMPLETAEVVALRILEHVKESVSHCGKETDVLILDSSGKITRKNQSDYHFELNMIELYDQMTSVLLPFSLELDMPEKDREIGFRLALSNYFQRLKILQDEKHNQEEAEREED